MTITILKPLRQENAVLILNTHSSNGDGNIPSLTIHVIPEGQVYVLDSVSL
jgi:hypothetical protein